MPRSPTSSSPRGGARAASPRAAAGASNGFDDAEDFADSGKSNFSVYYANGEHCTKAVNKLPSEAARKGVHAAFKQGKLEKGTKKVRLLVCNNDKRDKNGVNKWYGYDCVHIELKPDKVKEIKFGDRVVRMANQAKVVRTKINVPGAAPKSPRKARGTGGARGAKRAAKNVSDESDFATVLAAAASPRRRAASPRAASPRSAIMAVPASPRRRRGPGPLSRDALAAALMSAAMLPAPAPRGSPRGSPRARRV